MAVTSQIDASPAMSPATGSAAGQRANDGKAQVATDLKQERRRLETVTEILGGWVWETDSQHRFIYMSRNVEKLAGKRPEKHYGRTLEQLGVLPADTPGNDRWLAQLESRSDFGPVDFVRYDNGRPFFMRTSARPQFDEGGNFTGYIGIAYAVTEAPAADAGERRAAPRRRTVRAAEISIDGEALPISCVLIDISTTGARLKLPDDFALEGTFELSVAALSLKTHCEVRWRRGGEVGVEFVEES